MRKPESGINTVQSVNHKIYLYVFFELSPCVCGAVSRRRAGVVQLSVPQRSGPHPMSRAAAARADNPRRRREDTRQHVKLK